MSSFCETIYHGGRGSVASEERVCFQVVKPRHVSELRPVCVTSILSRVTERIIVKTQLLPAIPPNFLDGQFAYRPTGSTTVALITINHHVPKLLETNPHVRCLMVDFSKAFDSINHPVLASKLLEAR